MINDREGRAIVLGGSMAGLFAARALSETFAEVVIVDRDELTGPNDLRRGLPQGHHLHGLLARGQQITEEYFPGITEEMRADGAQTGDVADDVRWIINGKRLVQVESGLVALTSGRPFLERHVRDRVLALDGVGVLENADILRLRTTEDGRTVTGVTVRKDGAEQVLDADLVVDATGRGSRTSVWLEELGYEAVPEEKHKIGLGYTTRYYRVPDEAFEGNISINTVASAGIPRGAICQKIDGGRAIVTAYGILGDHPPTDPEGFLGFIKSLAAPDIHEVLQVSEPLDDPVAYKFPTNLRRHYQRMTDFPAGLLVIGDAVCSFNPSYAQGMTVAAMGSLVLRRHVAASRRPDALAYFRDLATDAVDGCWEMAVGADLSFPEVEGERTEEVQQAHAFIAQVQEAATRDAAVARAYSRVIGLVDPPSVLHTPEIEAALAGPRN
ncbi:FAD-dependent oxidoreductase [Streptomyces sp. TRM S81-3]|uniref:FAD-dependent oxidoreductase n=1 Tax=Streptomyces griseicoloratus TaxID=2752516 RepID=A0A926L9Y2_9ACTN|nr:FAD-dependent oxidoreductase [Streptomyces griseicoloratus]MBD0424109.1 FAD-dependent oxidoreductase [Streptomyces griseicoloratus]